MPALNFTMPYRPAFDSNAIPIPGAMAYFSYTGTTTPAPIYTDAGITIPASNPLEANGAGRFPQTFLDSEITYRLRIFRPGDNPALATPVEEYDPYEPVEAGAKGDPGSPGEGYGSRTALALAGNAASNLDDAYLTEIGFAGKFVYSTANLSAQVTASPRDYIGKQSDPTGATGAWVRQGADTVASKRAAADTVPEPLQTLIDRVGIWPEQYGSRVGGFDDTRLIKAVAEINANGGDRELILADEFILSTAGILSLTNVKNLVIRGPGALIIDGGAADTGIALRLVGVCDNVTFRGLRISGPGRSDATARQYGIGNNSGQTINNVWVDQCAFEDLNVGVGVTAESGGTAKNFIATRNIVKRMTGVLGGQGYGIFSGGATDVTIAFNQIEYAERHSIYVSQLAELAGQYSSTLVHANLIRNHRQTIQGGVNRHAIFMGRGFGGKISNNTIVDYWDGAIGVGQDTGGDGAPVRQAGDIEIVDNTLIGRQNALSSIQIAEPLVPTTATIQRIDVKRNKIYADLTVGGPQFEVEIYNGKTITVTDNDFYLANVPDGSGFRVIGVGTIAGPGDTSDVYIERNKTRGTAVTPSTVSMNFVRLFADVCTGTVKVVVRDNDNDTGFNSQNVEYNATPTNPNIIDLVPGQQFIGKYAPGDTTPTVANGVQQLLLTNASATDITNFDNGVTGQVLMLKFADANTTLKLNTNMRLAGDIVGSIYRTVQLVKSASGPWHPVSDITGS